MKKLFRNTTWLRLAALMALWAAPSALVGQTLTITPQTIDFGSANVGERITKFVFLISQSSAIQTVFVESSNQTFLPDPPSVQPVVNEPLQYNIIFLPRGAGRATGTITFYHRVNGQRVDLGTMEVSGEGLSPFDVSPSELNFGALPVGARSAPQFIQLKATQNLPPFDVSVRAVNPDAFEVSPKQVTVPTNGFATVAITFTPTESASATSTVLFNTPGVTLPVVVRGSGVSFTVDPPELVLPTTLTGCASTGVFDITPYSELDFLISPQNRNFQVNPSSVVTNRKTSIAVTIPAAAAGSTSDTIVINGREGGQITQQQLIPASVTAVEIQPTPGAIDFGAVRPGDPASERSLAIVSTTPGTEIGLGLTVKSNNAAFEPSVNGSVVTIRFSPATQRTFNGVITVEATATADGVCGRTLSIPVTGIGGNPSFTLSPSTVAFGEVGPGQSARTQVTLTNRSASSFSGSVAVDNAAFSIGRVNAPPNETTSIQIEPGAAQLFDVAFTPNRTGAFTGSATFLLTSAAGETAVLTLPLTGESQAMSLTYELLQGGQPTALAPGATITAPKVALGADSSFQVRVRNDSSESAVISAITVSGEGFELTGSYAGVSLATGETLSLPLRFAPSKAGRANSTLAIGRAQFPLTGVGLLRSARITGLPADLTAVQQSALDVELEDPQDAPLDGRLELAIEPLGGLSADPAAQFEGGGATTELRIRPDETSASFDSGAGTIGLQTGSVAATLRVTARLLADGEDVTPAGGVSATGLLGTAAPRILTAEVEDVTPTGFTLQVVGESVTREAVAATVELEVRPGAQVSDPVRTLEGINAAFAAYFSQTNAFGGLFRLTAPITWTGTPNGVAAVRVRITNAAGESDAVVAPLP
ncbi:MAG: choice-of-anchor D domain-containing protein [Acidobacteria bacterium]|nr:choice-of-anchor D domain-containing protein [Acidobacteriota bacterium]